MKRFLLTSIILISYCLLGQGISTCTDLTACNYDETAVNLSDYFTNPIVTASSMNVGIVTSLENNLLLNDQIGAFIITDEGDYYCVGLVDFEGENTVLNIYGDDPLTTVQDGCLPNEMIYFFVKRENQFGQFVVLEANTTLVDSQDFYSELNSVYVENGLSVFLPFNVLFSQVGCEYSIDYYNCNETCINDLDLDGICDELELLGCTDELACNYNVLATDNDDSCYFDLAIESYVDIPSCDTDDGIIEVFISNGIPPYSFLWSNGEISQNISSLSVGSYSVSVSDSIGCNSTMIFNLNNDDDDDGVCNENEILGCTDPTAYEGYNELATEEDGSCVYCASLDFSNVNTGLHLNGLNFENATGVTISFWMYDDDWSLGEDNQSDFGYLIDLGHEDSYRYVIRWRDGVKGLQAYYEGEGFQSLQGNDCDGIGNDMCYNYEKTNATYIIPPYDYVSNDDIYNWWENDGCGWKNITAVFCSNSVKLYVDGFMVQQSTTGLYYPYPIFSLDDNSLGSWNIAGAMNGDSLSWNGQIDEIRIWSRALSDNEIQERLGDDIDLNLNVFSEQSNNFGKLEGYWKFDSLLLDNKINGYVASNQSEILFSNQYCDYECSNSLYNIACLDNSNNDCDACTPSEGCMDELADNYDSTAEIDNGLCIYYGCMDDGNNIWSHIPGLEACNYNPIANVNQYSMTDFQNPCIYPIDIYGVGYLDCDGNCLYDCDNDGACDWNQAHCYDTEGNLLSPTDQINNFTFEPFPDGILDCLSFTYVDSVDNCVYNSGVDFVNNITLDTISDGVPDCLDLFDYSLYYNPLQSDVDGDGIGNSCDNDDGGQIGCMDINACNYDFWADNSCNDCCQYCFLNDCDTYPTTYLIDTIGLINGPYDCLGYCADLNNDGLLDDIDNDAICDIVDNCIDIWNPGQIDSDLDGVGDACEDILIQLDNYILNYTIFPNPFLDFTTIYFDNSKYLKVIKIFDTSGRLLYQDRTRNDVLNVYNSNLSSGFYFLEIKQNTFIKQDFLIVK